MAKSTITRDELNEVIATYGKHHIAHRMAIVLLAAMDSEPVALQPELAKVIYHFRDWNEGFPVERFKADYVISWMLVNYPPAPPAPVVPDAATAIRACLSEFPESARDIVEECADIAENACRAAMLAAYPQSPGSEPVTVPGKWIPVSERMPDDDDFVYIWPRPDFGVELHVGQYCECSPKGDGWYAQVYEQNYGIEWHPITVTHWMPLPAGPQEVK
nr:DUF551 domain-containing protein [Klebsiella quasipneumoniae]